MRLQAYGLRERLQVMRRHCGLKSQWPLGGGAPERAVWPRASVLSTTEKELELQRLNQTGQLLGLQGEEQESMQVHTGQWDHTVLTDCMEKRKAAGLGERQEADL
jgi:hypothetical protein